MSDPDINKMNFKQLKNEVQLLRDELALFKRKYEDAIYNLDSDNFGKSFTVEQNNMKAQIKITANSIKTMVSDTDLAAELEKYSTIEQTAEAIKTKVSNADLAAELKKYSTIEQTTEAISTEVTNINSATDNKLKLYSTLEQTAEAIKTTVSKSYVVNLLDDEYVTDAEMKSQISQTETEIKAEVSNKYATQNSVTGIKSEIKANSDSISAIVAGNYTEDLLSNYLTGIVISPNSIKMVNGNAYSQYNSDGLKFYDSSNQVEGWAIEPSNSYGGALNYYVNNGLCYTFGSGLSGTGYTVTDLVIKAKNTQRGRFVVDVSAGSYKEVKFVGMDYSSSDENSPYIYANEKLLATQDWVKANAGSGSVVAVFG